MRKSLTIMILRRHVQLQPGTTANENQPIMAPKLQDEIHQQTGFRSPGQELLLSIIRTASLLQHHFDQQTATAGITQQQYNVLRILRGSPDGLPVMDIGQRLLQPTPGISRLIKRLLDKKLIKRQQDHHDKRIYHCAITAEGQALLTQLQAPMDAIDGLLCSHLSHQDCSQAIATLENIRDQLLLKHEAS